jgi:DNA-binding XRE family transcriptional regulator
MSKATRPKIELTPEQRDRAKAIQERSRKHRPGPDELIERGEINELVPRDQFLLIRDVMAKLRALREARGMSLTDVSERSGMTRAAVRKLENGWNLNPTLETLVRYASSVDATLTVSILDHVSRRGGK